MQITPIQGEYFDRDLIMLRVSGDVLGEEKTFLTNCSVVQKTVDSIRQRIAKDMKELKFNLSLLAEMEKVCDTVQIVSPPEEDAIVLDDSLVV